MILKFMQSNFPSAKDVEEVTKDFLISGTHMGTWQTWRILRESRVLYYSVSPICGICNEVSP